MLSGPIKFVLLIFLLIIHTIIMEKFLNTINNDPFFSKNKVLILDLILLSWVFYVLFPLLSIGFISDEAYNSQILGKNISEGVTLWERVYF